MIRFFARNVLEIMSNTGRCQNFYAVKRGRVPGVYLSWPDCEKQIKEFPGAIFRKFSSKEDCLHFIHGKSASLSPASVSNELTPSLSLPVNIKTESLSDPDSTPESLMHSVNLLNQNMRIAMEDIGLLKTGLAEVRSTLARLEKTFFVAPGSKRNYSTINSEAETPQKISKMENEDNFTGSKFSVDEGIAVYTDGGCFLNGRKGAKAGLGVYWSPNDPDNVSEPLEGKPTNNRAEIYAALRAVQLAKKKGIKNLILHTDSQFLINGITKWIKNWKKNSWTKAKGSPVKNKEDFEALDEELVGINVKWVYVRGHNGDASNEAADRLAKCGAEKYV